MGASVVDDLKPRGEQTVELRKLDTVVDLDQELIAHRPKKALNLPLRGGRARAGVNQFHAEDGARPEQLGGHERGAAVNQNRCRNATRHQPGADRGLQAEHLLAGAPPPPDQHAGVIVDEREQYRPPRRRASQDRAVQAVACPQLIPRGGLEPAVDLPRRAAISPDVQPRPGEMGLQRPQPRHTVTVPGGGEHDLVDLRRSPLRPFALDRERQLERLGRRADRDELRSRNERVKPTVPVCADPSPQRRATDPDQPTVRPDMLTIRQRAQQPATLRLRQTRIGSVTDQRVPEQADFPAAVLVHQCLPLFSLIERGTLSTHLTPSKGRFVLPSSRPPENRDAISHGPAGSADPNRNTHARAVIAIASNASATPPPAGMIAPSSGSSATAHRVKCARISSARPANRRSQPRTVSGHAPNRAAIGRNPSPATFASIASPITATSS